MKGHITCFKKPAAAKPWKKLILAGKNLFCVCECELALNRVEPWFPKTAINWWLCCDKYSVTSGASKKSKGFDLRNVKTP